MTIRYTAAAKSASLDLKITSQVGASGFIRIYSGAQPFSPDDALSGNVLLAELPCSATLAPAAVAGLLTLNPITADSSANATGTANFGSIVTAGGVRRVDFSVGTSGQDLIMNTTSIVAGAQVSISSFTVTAAN